MVMQRDYLMRMIWQFTDMLGQMGGARKQRKAGLVEVKMEEWLGSNLGLSLKLIRALSDKDLIQLLTGGRPVESDKLIMVGRLLREDGELAEMQAGPEAAYSPYNKGLKLLLLAHEQGIEKVDYLDLPAETEWLINKLAPYSLDGEVLKGISRFYEETGRYAEAENHLFEWLELPDAEAEAIRYGTAMYNRLLALPDDQLEAGKLPRDEIEEALLQLHNKPVPRTDHD